jgi:hypothetical protein
MSPALPFELTPEAAKQLNKELRLALKGGEPALICQLGFEARTPCGRIFEHYEGEHFSICTYNPGQRPPALIIELLGSKVSIMPATLDRLLGRTLVVKKEVVGHGLFGKKKQKLVLALPPGPALAGVFQALDSPPTPVPAGWLPH